MRLFSLCEVCHKRRFLIKKRKIRLPIGELALSRKMMCVKCLVAIQRSLGFKN